MTLLKKFSVLLLVAFFFAGCEEEIPNPFTGQKFTVKKIGTGGGTVSLDDIATVEIPSGTFGETVSVKVSQTNEQATSDVFALTKALFGIDNWIGYEVRLNTADKKPQQEITVRLSVPQSFINSVQQDEGIEAFAMIYHDGSYEAHDDFSIISSEYISEQKELRFTLPLYCFTDTRTTDGSYEAVMTIAATPGVNSSNTIPDNSCGGQFISCMVDDCSTSSKEFDSDEGHFGTDFTASSGEVKAAADGKVVMIGNDARTSADGKQIGWGQFVIVENVNSAGQRFANLYAHLSSFTIGSKSIYSTGETQEPTNLSVSEGDLLGHINASGKLHFEYVANGNISDRTSKKDPVQFIRDTTLPRLMNASIVLNGSLNDCEYPTGFPNSGTTYKLDINFSDLTGGVNDNTELFLQDTEPFWSNPYNVLLTDLNTVSGTASAPDLCVQFGDYEHKRIRAYLRLQNGNESNCVYVTIIKPNGAK